MKQRTPRRGKCSGYGYWYSDCQWLFLLTLLLQDRLAPSGLVQSIIFGDFVAFFGAGLMAWVASSNTKKKMLEENAQEESEKREEHYRKMEGLIEKMSKDKETT